MQIAIIGTGMVGSAIAFSLATSGIVEKIILIDTQKKRALAEAMDISHATPFTFGSMIQAGDYQDLKTTDLIIITAGANQKEGETRFDLLNRNVAIFKEIVPQIMKYAPQAILLIATNPVDIMTEVTLKLSGHKTYKVFGTGTVLDSSRFRSILGHHLGISPTSVHANVIGEHGDSEVLLWSGAVAGTTPITQIATQLEIKLDIATQKAIENNVVNAAYEIIKGKGSTYYGIAAAVLHIVNAIAGDTHTILTVTSHHHKSFGNNNQICYALPSVVSKRGIEKALIPIMNEQERIALMQSTATLSDYTKKALSLL